MEINNYSINFLIKLKYETKPGEEIYIYGDSKEFGNWKSANLSFFSQKDIYGRQIIECQNR